MTVSVVDGESVLGGGILNPVGDGRRGVVSQEVPRLAVNELETCFFSPIQHLAKVLNQDHSSFHQIPDVLGNMQLRGSTTLICGNLFTPQFLQQGIFESSTIFPSL